MVDYKRWKPQQLSGAEYQQHLLGPVSEVVINMERNGVVIDLKILKEIEDNMTELAGEIIDDLADWTPRDINWVSWKQLGEWLHEQGPIGLGLPPSPYCKKGEVDNDKIATDDRALEWIGGNCPEHRAEITKIRKLRQVYRMRRYARDWAASSIKHADGISRLHPTFGLASDNDTRPGARTGRFGVKNPALNQVPSNPAHDPAGIKRGFVAPPGYRLLCIDYSQLEIVIVAHIIRSLFGDGDPLVERVIAGHDIHGPAARFIFGELAGNVDVANAKVEDFKRIPELKALRDLGKVGIYGKNYGKGEKGFAYSTFLPSGEPLGPARSKLLCNGLDAFYPGIPEFQKFIRQFIQKYGYIITLFGRWFPLPDAKSNVVTLRNRAWRQALNYPMQGGGQEIMILALILIFNDKLLNELGLILELVVHDEILALAPEQHADRCLDRMSELMTQCVDMRTPLRVEGKHALSWKLAKG